VAVLSSGGAAADRGRIVSRTVRLVLGLSLIGALYGLNWLSVAPNRLLPGQPVSAVQALGLMAYGIAGLVLAAEAFGWRHDTRAVSLLMLLAAAAIAFIGTGEAAAAMLQGRGPAARVMLGSGFWIVVGILGVLTFDHAREGPRWALVAAVIGMGLILTLGAAFGFFDRLSLMVEYRARMQAVHAAFWTHCLLAAAALGLALALAIPLGWAAFRSPRVEASVNAFLGAVQVTPAIALFGLLIPILSAILNAVPALRSLGIGAIGPAPALIGVAFYLALPLLRGLVSGVRAADPAAVEAARAMGMTERRILMEVRIPLGLPILVGALRVAAVQSIGLVTLGGLVGAGGLGAIVFEGMSQFAADLILLGALPVIALALAVDAAMAWASRRLEGLIL
jgi:osmoprotectant transport system permease protein